MSDPKRSPDTSAFTGSLALGSGRSPAKWPGGSDLFGPPHAPASPSASPAKGLVETIQDICGPTSFDSPAPLGPLSSWVNRLQARLATIGSTESPLIWKEKATPAGRSIYRLAPSTPRTGVSGSIGSPWPTPTVADIDGGRKTRSGSRNNEMLLNGLLSGVTPNGSRAPMEKRGAHRGVPNPNFAMWLMGFPEDLRNTILDVCLSLSSKTGRRRGDLPETPLSNNSRPKSSARSKKRCDLFG